MYPGFFIVLLAYKSSVPGAQIEFELSMSLSFERGFSIHVNVRAGLEKDFKHDSFLIKGHAVLYIQYIQSRILLQILGI